MGPVRTVHVVTGIINLGGWMGGGGGDKILTFIFEKNLIILLGQCE